MLPPAPVEAKRGGVALLGLNLPIKENARALIPGDQSGVQWLDDLASDGLAVIVARTQGVTTKWMFVSVNDGIFHRDCNWIHHRVNSPSDVIGPLPGGFELASQAAGLFLPNASI